MFVSFRIPRLSVHVEDTNRLFLKISAILFPALALAPTILESLIPLVNRPRSTHELLIDWLIIASIWVSIAGYMAESIVIARKPREPKAHDLFVQATTTPTFHNEMKRINTYRMRCEARLLMVMEYPSISNNEKTHYYCEMLLCEVSMRRYAAAITAKRLAKRVAAAREASEGKHGRETRVQGLLAQHADAVERLMSAPKNMKSIIREVERKSGKSRYMEEIAFRSLQGGQDIAK